MKGFWKLGKKGERRVKKKVRFCLCFCFLLFTFYMGAITAWLSTHGNDSVERGH